MATVALRTYVPFCRFSEGFIRQSLCGTIGSIDIDYAVRAIDIDGICAIPLRCDQNVPPRPFKVVGVSTARPYLTSFVAASLKSLYFSRSAGCNVRYRLDNADDRCSRISHIASLHCLVRNCSVI